MYQIKMNPQFTVSLLCQSIKNLIENDEMILEIIGEVSNLSISSNQHSYFNLKDKKSQIHCVMFNNYQKYVKELANGLQVVIYAKLRFYQTRGECQLLVHKVISQNIIGNAKSAFEKLKQKLQNEGIFDLVHKKSLPSCIQTLGVVSSATGAAIQDIIKVSNIKFCGLKIILYPCVVQGNLAVKSIVKSIEQANKHNKVDILLIARGGGSNDDLDTFNDESIVRAIFASNLITVTGIGHQIDYSLSDAVADKFFATPSSAVNAIIPDKQKLFHMLNTKQYLLQKFYMLKLQNNINHLQTYHKLLMNHIKKIQDNIQKNIKHLQNLQQQIYKLMYLILINWENKIQNIYYQLKNNNPTNILQRGYALIHDFQSKELIYSMKQTFSGQKLLLTLKDGKIKCIINNI